MAGTVGAIFNGALQLCSAVGIAAVSSIETSIEQKNGNPSGYAGRAAAFWFLLGIIGLEIISLCVFYKVEAEHKHHSTRSDETEIDVEKGEKDDGAEVYEERRSSEPDIDEKDEKGSADVVTSHCTEKLEDVREETVTR